MASILWAWPTPLSGCRRSSNEDFPLHHTAELLHTPEVCWGLVPCSPPSTQGWGCRMGQDLLASPGRLKSYCSHGYLSPYLFVWNTLCFLSLTPSVTLQPVMFQHSMIQVCHTKPHLHFLCETSLMLDQIDKSKGWHSLSAVIQLTQHIIMNQLAKLGVHSLLVSSGSELGLQVRQTFHMLKITRPTTSFDDLC